ncbi:hypothetical protein [Streptomyces sp. NPDC048462]
MEAEFAGEFETHLTVRPFPGRGAGDAEESVRLGRWAAEHV